MLNHAHRLAPAAPEEEHVFGACAPGWHSAADHATAVDDWIATMRDRGIERVCCLLSGQHLDSSEANVGRYRRVFGAEQVRHAPVADNHLVGEDALRETILPFLADSRDADAPVVVHGLAGIGRTGQVLAAWLVAHRGYEPREAVATVRETGRDPREAVQRGNATLGELRATLRSVE